MISDRTPAKVLAAVFTFGLLAFGADGLYAQLKENLDLPFDALGQEEDEEEAPEVVNFYNTNLEGDGFFYAIDKSSSMSQGELPRAKQEVTKNIREFSDRVFFGVLFFDPNLAKFPSNGQPAKGSPGMKAAGISFVQSTPGGSGSCCKEGLLAAIQMANMCKAKRKVIVYLGDGGGHCMGGDEAEYLQQTL